MTETPFGSVLAEPTRNGLYKAPQFHGSGTPIVNMGDLFAQGTVTAVPQERVQLSADELRRFSLAKGDLLFARRSLIAAGAGRCSIVGDLAETCVFESSIIRARVDPTKANPDFLYYLFSSPFGRYLMSTILRQVAVAGIAASDLVNLPLPLPPVHEQCKMASLLRLLDDKIELNRRQNRTLEALAQAVFKSWFIDFEPVQANAEGRRMPGMSQEVQALFPRRMEGGVPEGWGVRPLGETVTILTGGTPDTKRPEYWDGPIGWAAVADELPGPFVTNTAKTITQAGVDNSAAQVLPAWTVMISARGTVGRLALLGRPMAINQSCYGLAGRDGLGQVFTLAQVRARTPALQAGVHGAVFDTITRTSFDAVECVVPSRACAEAYEQLARQLYEEALHNQEEAANLAGLRNLLLPRLLSGEVRVGTTSGVLSATA
ncbi:MAG TPA: restriction endonuclease subunit S [Deinococcales bacterium]|nr:restriction endonuclease subunit S [Deinococcales bacterium]